MLGHRDYGERHRPPDPAKWTARARALLILQILKGEISISEAARRQGLQVATLERWKKQFLVGGENAVRPNPRLEKDLRESESRYRVLFDAGNDPVFVYGLDPDGVPGRFIEVNEVACRTLGYTRQELLQLGPVDIRAPEERAVFPGIAETLLKNERLVFESAFLAKGGARIPVEVSARLFSVGGRRGILAIARDITERRRTEAAYRSAIEVAEAARQVKNEFLSNVTHELRTPLNAILGYADLLLDEVEGPVAPVQRTSLEKIRDNGHRLLEIVDQVLDVSVAAGEPAESEPTTILLRQLVREATEAHRPQAEARGLELLWECASEVPEVLSGDAGRLGQVLEHLTDNAVKFTERGRVVLSVGLESRSGDEVELHLRVADTGIGIAPEDADVVFRPFVQLDASATRRHGGTGLGLAIVWAAVETLGGRIWVEGAPGLGSTFHVTLPLRIAAGSTPLPATMEGER